MNCSRRSGVTVDRRTQPARQHISFASARVLRLFGRTNLPVLERFHPRSKLNFKRPGIAWLSQNVDIGVYMRAITPAGSYFGQPVDGDVH